MLTVGGIVLLMVLLDYLQSRFSIFGGGVSNIMVSAYPSKESRHFHWAGGPSGICSVPPWRRSRRMKMPSVSFCSLLNNRSSRQSTHPSQSILISLPKPTPMTPFCRPWETRSKKIYRMMQNRVLHGTHHLKTIIRWFMERKGKNLIPLKDWFQPNHDTARNTDLSQNHEGLGSAFKRYGKGPGITWRLNRQDWGDNGGANTKILPYFWQLTKSVPDGEEGDWPLSPLQ